MYRWSLVDITSVSMECPRVNFCVQMDCTETMLLPYFLEYERYCLIHT